MSQKLIASAVDDVLSLTDAGESPRNAIVKVAYAKSLLPDQITRVCQVYNRSASLLSRVGDGGYEDKLASVSVIDPRQVIQDVTERKVAASATRGSAKLASVPTAVRLLETPDRDPTSMSGKSAQFPGKVVVERSRHAGIYDGLTYKQAVLEADSLKSRYEDLQRQGFLICHQIKNQSAVLRDQVAKRAGVVKSGLDFVRDLEYQVKQAGESVQWLADDLIRYAVSHLPNHKRASWKDERYIPTLPNPDSQRVTAEVQKLAALWRTLETDGVRLATESAEIRERLYILGTHLTPYGVKNASLQFTNVDYATHQLEHVAKVANMFGSLLGTQLNKARAATPAQDPREQGFRLKLNQPQHVANLGAIRTRTALQELLTDDPVLSAADPTEVVSAYNELATYAPQALQSTAVMRAVLRQYLQNNASSFDLSEIRKLERGQPVAK